MERMTVGKAILLMKGNFAMKRHVVRKTFAAITDIVFQGPGSVMVTMTVATGPVKRIAVSRIVQKENSHAKMGTDAFQFLPNATENQTARTILMKKIALIMQTAVRISSCARGQACVSHTLGGATGRRIVRTGVTRNHARDRERLLMFNWFNQCFPEKY
ncbi:hypothetical protein DPMN_004616 [Dreissena polymorpha]|uniref:Uncharacterized protein n=1 Tax=Dreissena polymorpha TaxID=45954 RepID=A0A9D4RTP9_DREPO|nr:hypothetical protein DPMN_004616 [Dreissena polymorpha]